MPVKIPLNFFLTARHTPILPGSDIWHQPLPTSRLHQGPTGNKNDENTISYGDYLAAVGRFLENDNYRVVMTALAHGSQGTATAEQVSGLAVFLVKHGEFYHPARVVIETGAAEYAFVVNGAVSDAGRAHITVEFSWLAGLYEQFDTPVVPRVFHLGEIETANGDVIPMFSAEWFDGFCEFHLTEASPEKKSNLVVWEKDESTYYLTREQAMDMYGKVAFTLTTAYNFYTFEHISAWHHAAGDFIIKPLDEARVDLRLITVRSYTPLIDNPAPDPADMIEGLLLFLMKLSIRNRLDRLDGTGDLAWAGDDALKGTIDGFFRGLSVMAAKLDLPTDFRDQFENVLSCYPPEALQTLFSAVVDKIPASSPEHGFLHERITAHAALFHSILASA